MAETPTLDQIDDGTSGGTAASGTTTSEIDGPVEPSCLYGSFAGSPGKAAPGVDAGIDAAGLLVPDENMEPRFSHLIAKTVKALTMTYSAFHFMAVTSSDANRYKVEETMTAPRVPPAPTMADTTAKCSGIMNGTMP